LELYEGGVHQVQRLFETWITAISAVLIAEGMEENVAKEQSEKAVILVQVSLILSQVVSTSTKLFTQGDPFTVRLLGLSNGQFILQNHLNNTQVFKRIIGDLPKELLLS
jgi:hypothetical protein